jgi:hypothetical protein
MVGSDLFRSTYGDKHGSVVAGYLLAKTRCHRKEHHQSLGVSESWLAKRRIVGLPPGYVKLGKTVVYDQDELDRFITACRRRSTSEAPS